MSAELGAARDSIRSRVRELGPALKGTRSVAMIAVLAGAALWPVAAPFLGTGAALGSLSAAIGLLGGPGGEYLSGVLKQWAGRHTDSRDTGALRTDLEQELLRRLEGDSAEAAALRADVSRLLQEVGAVDTALGASTPDVREALASGLAELSERWDEFRWMLGDLRDLLVAIQAKQAESLALQRHQTDLQREQLVKLNLLLRVRTPIREASPPEADEVEAPAAVPSPYKGLEAFQPEDAGLFFGREELVAELLARVAERPFLAVVGASGSGKSSVLRAGLVPAIWEGALTGSASWDVIVMTPGERPLRELAMRLSLLRGLAGGSLLNDLRSDPAHMDLAVRQALVDEPEDVRLVLVVDQLEEAVTLCRDEGERDAFLAALAAAGSRAVVIVGLRADFYARFTAHRELLQVGQVLVGPMTSEDLRRAVERPATEAGLSLEPGLADTILADLGREPGALPLLSHALLETWERRRGRRLTIAGYQESGGVRGAIARTADRIFEEEFTTGQQALARGIFLRLTELGEGTEDTRRRTTLDELVPQPEDRAGVEAVVDTLAAHRLLTVGEDSVEVAHEALIRRWPRLRAWLNEDRQALRVQRRLTEAALEWERLDRDAGLLFRGARLDEAGEWRASGRQGLNPLERDFLAASFELAESESRSRRRRLVTLAAVLVAGLVVSSTAAIVALSQRDAAEKGRAAAEQQRNVATSRELAASATAQLASDPELGLLLAREAARAAPTDQAREVLRTALLESRLRPPLVGSAGVVFSPDGRVLVAATSGTANDEPSLEVWSMTRRRRLAELGPGSSAAAFSPDGAFLASASRRGFEIRDTRSWRVAGALERSGPPVSSLAVGPTGARVIAITGDGRARAWNVGSGRQLATLEAPAGARVDAAAFSPGGDLAVTTGFSDAGPYVRLWDARSWHLRRTITDPGVGTLMVGSRYLLSDALERPRIWRLAPGARRPASLQLHETVAVSPNGQLLATSGPLGRSRAAILDVRSGAELATLPQSGGVATLSFSHDGRFVAVGTQDGRTHVIEVPGGREVVRFRGTAGTVTAVEFSAGGNYVVTESADDTAARFWATPVVEEDAVGGGHRVVTDLGFGPAGAFALVHPSETSAEFWKARDQAALRWREARKIRLPASDIIGALTPDGELMAVVNERRTKVARTATGAVVLDEPGGSTIAAFSPDARFVLSGIDDLAVWDIVTQAKVATLHADNVQEAAVGVGGRVAIISELDRLNAWSLATGRRIKSLVPADADLAALTVTDIVMSRDGELAIVLWLDGTSDIWSTKTWRHIATLRRHDGQVLDADVSPNHEFVVTAGADDGTARIWELETGRLVTTLDPPVGSVYGVAFAPDGASVLVGGDDGTIRKYECEVCRPLRALVELAESRASRKLTAAERREFLHAP